MPRIVLSVPLADVPDLFRSAVRAVDRAVLVEVTEDRGRVGRRTNFAAKSEVTLFTFRAVSETTSEVRAVSTTGGVFGDLASYPDVVLETGRAVLDELARRLGSASR